MPDLIFVTGANGFLGSHVCRLARARGLSVRALVRPGADRSLLADIEGLEFVEGAIGGDEDPAIWVEGATAIVHAAAATSEMTSDWELSRRVNVAATRRLAEAARDAGVGRFVFISSQSANPANMSPYGTTKLEGEKALAEVYAEGAPNFTILRPGVIYGVERRGIFAKLEDTLAGLPAIPVIGDGKYLQFPVHVDDVAAASLDVAACEVCAGKTYELGGEAPIAFIDLLRLLLKHMGKKKPLLPLPIFLCRMIATVGGAVMKNPPINHSNIEGLLTAPPLDIEPAKRDFGYAPRDVQTGLDEVYRARAEQE